MACGAAASSASSLLPTSAAACGQHAVVDGEERQLEPVADAGLVVDGAQVVLDDLLGGLEAEGDLAVLAALHDERDDAHLLGGEPVADARAHHVFLGRVGHHELRRQPGVAGGHRAHALHQGRRR